MVASENLKEDLKLKEWYPNKKEIAKLRHRFFTYIP